MGKICEGCGSLNIPDVTKQSNILMCLFKCCFKTLSRGFLSVQSNCISVQIIHENWKRNIMPLLQRYTLLLILFLQTTWFPVYSITITIIWNVTTGLNDCGKVFFISQPRDITTTYYINIQILWKLSKYFVKKCIH